VTHAHIHAHTRKHTHILSHTHTHTLARAHTHTCTHTYLQDPHEMQPHHYLVPKAGPRPGLLPSGLEKCTFHPRTNFARHVQSKARPEADPEAELLKAFDEDPFFSAALGLPASPARPAGRLAVVDHAILEVLFLHETMPSLQHWACLPALLAPQVGLSSSIMPSLKCCFCMKLCPLCSTGPACHHAIP